MKQKNPTPDLAIPNTTPGLPRGRNKLPIWSIPIMLVVMVVLMAGAMYRSYDTRSKASGYRAVLSLKPAEKTLAAGESANFDVYLDPGDTPLIFARVTVAFDPEKLTLIEEPRFDAKQTFKRRIANTTVDEANKSGKYTVTVGVDPQDTPPGGTDGGNGAIRFLSFRLQANSAGEAVIPVTLDLAQGSTQLVAGDARVFAVTVNPASVTITTPPPVRGR